MRHRAQWELERARGSTGDSAAASHSFLHPTGETWLYIDVPDAFDGTKTVINEIETSQTLEIKLVKQAKKAPIQLKVNKVKR